MADVERLDVASRVRIEIIDPRDVDAFVEVEPFNNEPYAHHWFQKDLRQK